MARAISGYWVVKTRWSIKKSPAGFGGEVPHEALGRHVAARRALRAVARREVLQNRGAVVAQRRGFVGGEVDQNAEAPLGDHDVFTSHVAVDHAPRVGVRERVEELIYQPEPLDPDEERPSLEPVGERRREVPSREVRRRRRLRRGLRVASVSPGDGVPTRDRSGSKAPVTRGGATLPKNATAGASAGWSASRRRTLATSSLAASSAFVRARGRWTFKTSAAPPARHRRDVRTRPRPSRATTTAWRRSSASRRSGASGVVAAAARGAALPMSPACS